MKVRVQIQHGDFKIDERAEGKTADDIVGVAKGKVAAKLPFAMRLVVNGMSNTTFIQEIVKRYNAELKPNPLVPIPTNAEEFLETAVKLGFVTIEEP
jgi:hypothetical protein